MAILFDFGGTLDSDGEHWLDRFYELYEDVCIDLPREELKRVFYRADALCCADPCVPKLGLRPLMQHHVKLQMEELGLSVPALEDRLVEGFCSRAEWFLVRNTSLLSRLRERFHLGVVSNFYGNVANLCEEAGLARWLEAIVDSTRVGMSKPDPRIFHIAMDELGVCSDKTIFVGDSYENDMMPARKIGMRTIWLKGTHPRIPYNAEPVDCCISKLTDLEVLLT
jgi:putative hydrolase of the HAD superfamily